MRAIIAIAATSVLAGGLTACAELGGSSIDGSDVSVQGPLLVISETPSADGDASQLAGPLSYESGCMRVGGRLVVWPKGTAWDDSAALLRFQSGSEASVGDQISTQAVVYDANELIEEWGGDDEIATDVATQLRGCAATGEVAVVAAG